VLYDPDRYRAHSLNRVAVAIWRHCNGNNSVTTLRQLASLELGVPVEEGVVWRALGQLQSAHLLVEEDPRSAVSRRAILGKAGRLGIAAMATPLLASAFVPVPAAAASRPSGLPSCGPIDHEDESEDREEAEGCSNLNPSCTCSKTTAGAHVCINPSTALKETTCRKDRDCKPGYLCIPRGNAPPRCIAPCAVPSCVC
jgi:hypothetical protein